VKKKGDERKRGSEVGRVASWDGRLCRSMKVIKFAHNVMKYQAVD